MATLPLTVESGKKKIVLFDFTDNPVRVMSLAWEVMLGQPDLVVDGYKVLGAPIDEILKARHKTVMEYVGFSFRLYGFRLEYLAQMASCRAGFSVSFMPTTILGEYTSDVGCTLLSLFSWMKSGFNAMPIEHYSFRSMMMEAVEQACPELHSILKVQVQGV